MHSTQVENKFDLLIIGAGLSGVCSLYHARKQFPEWRIKLIEAGEGVGGVWHWNRYPGARFDSESLSYGFSFDKELLQEWAWTEEFAPQAETEKYVNKVCEKHNLYEHMKFNTKIDSARWDNNNKIWTFTDSEGFKYETTFFISCIGFLSAPTLPNITGIENFKGASFHTSKWPKDLDYRKDFANKRVGVIGTGATGIQTITAVAKESDVKSLTVFQRTANWACPLHNAKISPEQMDKYRTQYDDIFQRCLETPTCFIHKSYPQKSSDATPEERQALWEKLYSEPGMTKWLAPYNDTYTDREANRLYSSFMEQKIRSRIHDPKVADKLIPNHGFGTRRVPLESGYYEVFNKPNVHLVDLLSTPVTTVTDTGIITSDGQQHELDILIYATGFDAVTGAFSAIDWQGKDGRPLMGDSDSEAGKNAVWPDARPHTYLGFMSPGMPNFFTVLGPHQPFGNATRSIEHVVPLITELLAYCKEKGYAYVEPTDEAADQWTEHVVECSKGALLNEVDSWMTGVNKNVKGKTVRTVARYAGSAIEYRRRCEASRAAGWEGFRFA
ncbi:cyclohexanone monooxygenase [Myriangium duriaei CBS 260.36]|uniref:Cyclohexanone monooxygenase n=1 Tax=Myriangium duriaei CBS 260.36 TaxID=1168546 RepID=A0A9P4MLQ6_9PEZI|nr:cyclohexanone monooxygenase [Myriangium duriaei CBS 260.36]